LGGFLLDYLQNKLINAMENNYNLALINCLQLRTLFSLKQKPVKFWHAVKDLRTMSRHAECRAQCQDIVTTQIN